MADEHLKDVFAKAAEIAAAVPQELRQTAFSRALDHLLGSGARKSGAHRLTKTTAQSTGAAETNVEVGASLDQIDRTSHPEVTRAPRVLERSLMILKIARDELGVDGLRAPDLARVLTEKFRLRTTRQAVTQALDMAADKVDRVRSGPNIKYRIMAAGETYVEAGHFTDSRSSKRNRSRPTSKPAVAKTENKAPAAASNKRRTFGPKDSVDELVKEGFFATARRIADVREHLRHKKGRIFALPELSPALLRLVRSQRLDREQAADGQYEYKAK